MGDPMHSNMHLLQKVCHLDRVCAQPAHASPSGSYPAYGVHYTMPIVRFVGGVVDQCACMLEIGSSQSQPRAAKQSCQRQGTTTNEG